MAATVRELIQKRSTLAESIKNYYLTLIREMDRTPWQHDNQAPVTASDVAVPVRVRKKVTNPTRVRGEGSRRKKEEERARRTVDPETARLYEIPWEEGTEEVPWSREWPQLRRALVRGAPGGGKTILTQMTALELARQGLAQWEERSTELYELPLPVWVELKRLASSQTRGLREALLVLLAEDPYSVTGRLFGWLVDGLRARSAFLILDGLDEVEPADHSRLTSFLHSFDAGNWDCRVLLTCRTANYDQLKDVIPWQRTEYELAPFGSREVRRLIDRWYRPEDTGRTALQTALETNYPLLHACETPILATLACLANEDRPLSPEAGRRELYLQLLESLLTKQWRSTSLPALAPLDDLLDLLRLMAWRLFSTTPQANRFSHTQVNRAIASSNRDGNVAEAPAGVRIYLLARGLLVGAGKQDGERQYSFLHRTVLEFLAAEHLVRAVREDGWEKAAVAWTDRPKIPVSLLVAKQSWLTEWKEPILFLAEGFGKDPEGKAGLLVDGLMMLLLEGEPQDVFGYRVCLAAECLSSVPHSVRRASPGVMWANRLTTEVWELYRSYAHRRQRFPHLQAGWRAAVCLNGKVRSTSLNSGSEDLMSALLGLVVGDATPWPLRQASAHELGTVSPTLGRVPVRVVVEMLLRVLETERATDKIRGATLALTFLAFHFDAATAHSVAQVLLRLVESETAPHETRSGATWILETLLRSLDHSSLAVAVAALLRVLESEAAPEEVRRGAARSLAGVPGGTHSAEVQTVVAALLRVLKSETAPQEVREGAAHSLGELARFMDHAEAQTLVEAVLRVLDCRTAPEEFCEGAVDSLLEVMQMLDHGAAKMLAEALLRHLTSGEESEILRQSLAVALAATVGVLDHTTVRAVVEALVQALEDVTVSDEVRDGVGYALSLAASSLDRAAASTLVMALLRMLETPTIPQGNLAHVVAAWNAAARLLEPAVLQVVVESLLRVCESETANTERGESAVAALGALATGLEPTSARAVEKALLRMVEAGPSMWIVKSAVDDLIRLASSLDRTTMDAVVTALLRMLHSETSSYWLGWVAGALSAIDHLIDGEMIPEIVGVLSRVIKDESATIRSRAVSSLRRLAIRLDHTMAPVVVDILLPIIKNKTAPAHVRMDAIDGLVTLTSFLDRSTAQTVIESLLAASGTAADRALARILGRGWRLVPNETGRDSGHTWVTGGELARLPSPPSRVAEPPEAPTNMTSGPS